MSGAVTIRRCASAEEAAIVCALLNDAGIPILITHIIAAAYFLVPLSIFVFLGRRFLKQREERKLTR